MRGERLSIIALVPLVFFATVGCEPGFTYLPVNSAGQTVDTWSETVDGVRIETHSFTILVGKEGTLRGLKVTNDSTVDVVVLGATLTSKGRMFNGKVSGDDPRHWTVRPGESKDVSVYWDFRQSGVDPKVVFGDAQIKWTWNVRIGEKDHAIVVTMRKK